MSTKFGFASLILSMSGLDVLHIVQLFHRALFAGGDDQALLAGLERNLGLARLEVDRLG